MIHPNDLTFTTRRTWAGQLDQMRLQAETIGSQLIELRDRQTGDLEAFLATEAGLTSLLLDTIKLTRLEDVRYQAAVTGMVEATRAMLTSVTSYIASPDETKRGQFTEAAITLRQNMAKYAGVAESTQEREWSTHVTTQAGELQNLGLQLISERDLQQSQFANFIAIVFSAGQETIVGKIQPFEADLLTQAQQSVENAVRSAVAASIGLPLLITLAAGWLVWRLSRPASSRFRSSP